MGLQRGGVAPTFEKPQPERIFAINLHVVFDIAILSARPMHVLQADLHQKIKTFASPVHRSNDDNHHFLAPFVLLRKCALPVPYVVIAGATKHRAT